MKHYPTHVSVILIGILGTILWSHAVAASTQSLHIIAFGDSITQGWKRDASGTEYGVLYPPNGARTSDGYEPELETILAAETYLTHYVYNWGEAGEHTYEGVNRIDSVINSQYADYILIMEGANDLYAGVSASTTKANLQIMIEKSQASQIVPILATITPNTASGEGYLIPTYYNPAIQSLASEKSITLCDQYAALVGNWLNYTSGDGLHLNDTGEQVMAQTWYDSLSVYDLPMLQRGIVPMLHLLLLDE